ncbi:hypothetical protein [Nocardia grenadensis]|uniref:hypothetical protein n=1 Tax=Nocardia grenadensis TaxID=931537 RepID=UPI0007A4DB41|nr:hypothetical protein [Nocardia grenadensis]
MNFRPGDKVRIERDETLYPPKGTWPRFRGLVGTVTEVNRDRTHAHLTEYGVIFTKPRTPRENGSIAAGASTTWFKRHELVSAGTRKDLATEVTE